MRERRWIFCLLRSQSLGGKCRSCLRIRWGESCSFERECMVLLMLLVSLLVPTTSLTVANLTCSLTFTSGPVTGKKMIIQVTTTGNDLGSDQFNIAIPGGGEGSTHGCTKQYGRDVWGADYGGVSHRDDCDALPAPLQAGCYWRFDWFRNADNPAVSWEKVTCPEQLSYTSNCRRNDDPLPGQNTPTPTPTTTAPISSGTVQPGGQCGGKTYRGPTRCVGGTVCTFVDENSYYCKTAYISTT
jgi:hypothetical protein